MMECHDASLRIDERLDGTLDAAGSAALAAHLAGCAACRAELAALERLRTATRALPISPVPPPDLWPGVAARTVAARRQPWAWAAVAVVGVSAALVWQIVERAPSAPPVTFASSDEQYPTPGARRAALVAQVTGGARAVPSETRAIVERNMELIQQALHEIELAVERDPNDPNLRQLLIAMHMQESALIDRIQRLGVDANRRTDI